MGSKGTNTYNTTSAPPPWLSSAYQGLVSGAQNIAQTPFVPYGGQMVAPVNPQESAGIGQVNAYANYAQPWINQAGIYAAGAAAPITGGQIAQYADPYTGAVAGATEKEMALLDAQRNQNVVGNAISSGAWGGDRASVAQSELAGQEATSEAPALAQIEAQGYTTGISTAEAEQQAEAQGAYSMGQLGQAAQTLGEAGAGAEIQGGQLQQGTQQALDTAQMQQYYTQLGYPFQTAAWLAAIETGVGSTAGGTSSTTAPAPNPLNALLGIGATAAGAYFGAHKRGGGIDVPARHHYDGGGGIFGGQGIDFLPQLNITHGSGPPKPPVDPGYLAMHDAGMFGGGSGGSFGMTPKLGESIGKGIYNWQNGPDTSGAGSGFPLEGSADANSLDDVVSMNDMGFGVGEVNTGGAVWPKHAGLGFKGFQFGGGPEPDYPSANPPPGAEGNALDKDFTYNKNALAEGLARDAVDRSLQLDRTNKGDQLPSPTVNYTGTDMPPQGGGLQPPPFTPTGGPLDEDRLGISPAAKQAAQQPQPTSPYPMVRPPPPSSPPSAGINVADRAPPPAAAPSYSDYSHRPEDTRTWGQKLSVPLMEAGFALMASRSPFLANAIGEAGLAGIRGYISQEQEKRSGEEKQQDIGLRAKQMSDAADNVRKRLQQAQEFHDVPVGYQKTDTGLAPTPGGPADPAHIAATAAARGETLQPFTDANGQVHLFNKQTGQWVDMPGGASGAPGSPTATTEADGSYHFENGSPKVKKGDDVPDPTPVGGNSSSSIKDAAMLYLETGKPPAGWLPRAGNSPVAIRQTAASTAMKNYAAAIADSRGMSPQEVAEAQRVAPGSVRFIAGQPGNQVVSIGTAMRHLDTINKLADEWDKATISGNWQTVRALQGRIAAEFGSAEPTNLQAAARIVGPEIIKAIGVAGAGTTDERQHASDQFSTAAGSDQIHGAVKTTQELLLGQLTGKEQQASVLGITPEMFQKLVGPGEYKRLKELQAAHDAGPQPGATPAAQQPAAAAPPLDVIPSDPNKIDPTRPYNVIPKNTTTPRQLYYWPSTKSWKTVQQPASP